jgi:hypothetical protein
MTNNDIIVDSLQKAFIKESYKSLSVQINESPKVWLHLKDKKYNRFENIEISYSENNINTTYEYKLQAIKPENYFLKFKNFIINFFYK